MGWGRRRAAGKATKAAATGGELAEPVVVPPPSAVAAVIFTAPESRLREMTVEAGPCVPLPGGKGPLVSPHLQQYSEGPRQTAALFTALTGQSADSALVMVEERAGGSLLRFSEDFVAAMAEANRLHLQLADEDDARGDKELTTFVAARRELDAGWMAVGDWPASQVSTWNKLTRLGRAQEAQEEGQALYAWYGPSVAEYAITRGRSDEASDRS